MSLHHLSLEDDQMTLVIYFATIHRAAEFSVLLGSQTEPRGSAEGNRLILCTVIWA